MNIRSADNYQRSFWSWSFLNDCFQWGIRVSDIDGTVERKGNVLFFETKPPSFVFNSADRGQYLLFRSWAMAGFTVFVLFGEPNDPVGLMRWYPNKLTPMKREDTTEDAVRDLVGRWYKWADANPREWFSQLEAA